MNKVNDLTVGNEKKLILAFFFPMLATNMLQQLYSFADIAIVGKGLGDNALAAVGNMGSLHFLIIGFSLGLANGFSVLIAQHFGAKEYDRLRKTMAASIKLAAVIAVLLTFLSVVFLEDALNLLQTDSSIMNDCLTYGYIIFGGLSTAILYNMSAAILRAFGDSRTPLKAIVASSILNILLDIVFIFGIHMGVEGAAIATVFSQLVSAGICISRIRNIEYARLSRQDYVNDIKMYLNLLKNGVPMAFMNSLTAVGCMVVQYFVNGLGVAYTAAYSACSKYMNLFMTPSCSAGHTMSAFTSQNYGAKEYKRIKHGLVVCLEIAMISYIILGSAALFFAEPLARILLSSEDAVALACRYMPVCGSMLFAVDFLFVFRSGVQGMGYPLVPMCSGIVEMVLRIGTIALFIENTGFMATAYAEIGAWSGALLLNLIAFVYILMVKSNPEKHRKYA